MKQRAVALLPDETADPGIRLFLLQIRYEVNSEVMS
jgi:hypothetical protein